MKISITIFILVISLFHLSQTNPICSRFGSSYKFSCDVDGTHYNTTTRNAACLFSGNDAYCVGYQQVSSTNKNPILIKYTNGVQVYCITDLEVTPDDGSGQSLILYNNVLYGIFTSTGTQGQSNQDFRRATVNGWLKHYTDGSTSGGGAKVAIVVEIDSATGALKSGSFITARLNTGKTNSASIKAAGIDESGNLVLGIAGAFAARNINKSSKNCSCTDCVDSAYYNNAALWNWQVAFPPSLVGLPIYSYAPGCDRASATPVTTIVSCIGPSSPLGWDWNTRQVITNSVSAVSNDEVSYNNESSNSGLSTGAWVGIAIGIVVGAILVVVVIVIGVKKYSTLAGTEEEHV